MKLLIVDDHLLIRKGVRLLLEKIPSVHEIIEADNGTAAITLAQQQQPAIILLDLSMPGGLDGFTVAKSLQATVPQAKIIVLTMHDEEAYIKQALQLNIAGYLLKNSEENELEEAIQTVSNGQSFYRTKMPIEVLLKLKRNAATSVLTPRETEVLSLVGQGYTNRQVGEQLHISTKTVERHKANMMHKLQLKETHELIQYSIRNHYVDVKK